MLSELLRVSNRTSFALVRIAKLLGYLLARLAPCLLSNWVSIDSSTRAGLELISTVALICLIALPKKIHWSNVLVEGGVGAFTFFWIGKFGASYSPWIFFALYVFRFLCVRLLTAIAYRLALETKVVFVFLEILIFDFILTFFFPYLNFYPCFLGFATGKLWIGCAATLGIIPAFFLWTVWILILGVLACDLQSNLFPFGASIIAFTCASILVPSVTAQNAIKLSGITFYTIGAPRLYAAFEELKARETFYAELECASEQAPHNSIMMTAEGFFPRPISVEANKLPLALRKFVKVEALLGIHFLGNITAVRTENQNKLYNGVGHVTQNGAFVDKYFKRTLIPFGEYVPDFARGTLVETTLSAVGGEFSVMPAGSPDVFQMNSCGGVRIAPRICVENADISCWWKLRKLFDRGGFDIISVFSDGSRFRSANFDALHFMWSRLLACFVGCPVIHVPSQSAAVCFFPDGSAIHEKVTYRGDMVLAGCVSL